VGAAGIGSLLLILGLTAWETLTKLKIPRLLDYIGAASYSLYLVHLPILVVLVTLAKHFHVERVVPAGGIFVFCILFALACGCLTGQRIAANAPNTRRFLTEI